MSRRLPCCILAAAIVLPVACRRDPPAQQPPVSTELEGRVQKAEERLRRTEDALAKSQAAINDLQARANQRPPSQPVEKPPQPNPVPPPAKPKPPAEPQITLAKFNAVEVTNKKVYGSLGMKYEAVVKIMGCEGIEKFNDGKTCIMAWDNPDGSGARVFFVIVSNGRFATSKSQHDLH